MFQEDDQSLTDNATGSSNFADKAFHSLNLIWCGTSLDVNSTTDDNFVEIGRVVNGRFTLEARSTEYSAW